MAWTAPKTWVTGDPLNASNMNTYIRDNQVALKAQTDDAEAKLGKHHPAYLSPLLVGYAVIGINTFISITSTSYVVWHANCKLTFTPKTDLVLFGVQFAFDYSGAGGVRNFSFGLRKDGVNISLSHTAVTGGSLGNAVDLLKHSTHQDLRNNNPIGISYQAPVSVTRNTEVTISPTVKVQSGVTAGLDNVMILTALDVGAYE